MSECAVVCMTLWALPVGHVEEEGCGFLREASAEQRPHSGDQLAPFADAEAAELSPQAHVHCSGAGTCQIRE